jgi:peptidoglycan/xylan/chitin deacetylase (PgdA/CDA1 family)
MVCITAAALSLSLLASASLCTVSTYGVPKVMRFLGGAEAAVSLQFDDSMTSQLANALPLLNARGLRATFFVNTESYQYKSHRHEWEVDVLKAGHELGNHTAHHSGAKNLDELANEIGSCSDQLSKVYGGKARLMSFAIPGGVPWSFTPAQLNPVLDTHLLTLAEHRNFFDEKQTDPITFVQSAIQQRKASNVSMHGVGGEWLSTSVPNLTKLLDFLVARREEVWTAPEIEIVKYCAERDAADVPVVKPESKSAFSISVRLEPTKLHWQDVKTTKLYDQALTISIEVPAAWKSFRVTQGAHQASYSVQPDGTARFEVIPGETVARVAKD